MSMAVVIPLHFSKGGEAGTTTSGRQRVLAKKYSFQDLRISIENAKGSYRAGVGPDGREWRVYMYHDYGYIRGTEGNDGEHLDVYVGPEPESTQAYVVRQVSPDTGAYDEDKVLLGFGSSLAAKTAYLKQYDTPKFFGGIRSIPMDAFKLMLRTHKGKRLTTGSAKRFLIKAPIPDAQASMLQWEPPGGSHPNTWRAEFGGTFIYRRAKPGADVGTEESGGIFTTEEKEAAERAAAASGSTGAAGELITLRQQTLDFSSAQHKAAAAEAGQNIVERDFHQAEAQKKFDLKAFRGMLLDDLTKLSGGPS